MLGKSCVREGSAHEGIGREIGLEEERGTSKKQPEICTNLLAFLRKPMVMSVL